MTTSYCLSPVLRLNKANWYICKYIYWETALPYNHLVIWFQREVNWSWQSYFCLTVRLYVFGAKWLVNDVRTFIHFVLTSVWKWHALFVCYIYLFWLQYGSDILLPCIPFMVWRKRPQLRKPLLYYLVLNRNNYVVKNIFIVCLFFLGGWPRHEAS